jgi:hypothetical protein
MPRVTEWLPPVLVTGWVLVGLAVIATGRGTASWVLGGLAVGVVVAITPLADLVAG